MWKWKIVQFDAYYSVLYALSGKNRDLFRGVTCVGMLPHKKMKNGVYLIKFLGKNSSKLSMFIATTTKKSCESVNGVMKKWYIINTIVLVFCFRRKQLCIEDKQYFFD